MLLFMCRHHIISGVFSSSILGCFSCYCSGSISCYCTVHFPAGRRGFAWTLPTSLTRRWRARRETRPPGRPRERGGARARESEARPPQRRGATVVVVFVVTITKVFFSCHIIRPLADLQHFLSSQKFSFFHLPPPLYIIITPVQSG